MPIWNSPDTFANTFTGSVMFYDQATPLPVTSGATVNGDLVVQAGGSLIGTVTDPDRIVRMQVAADVTEG